MEEARSKSEAGCDAFLIANSVSNFLQTRLVVRIHLNVAEQGEIVAVAETVQMGAEVACERLIIADSFRKRIRILGIGKKLDATLFARPFKDRLFGRKGAGLLVLLGQTASSNLAGFDIGLIEGVDAEDGSGHRSCNLPAEKFLTEVVNI